MTGDHEPMPTRRRSGARDRVIDLLVLVIALSPLLLTQHIPLSDLPNHLARQYVLADWAHSRAFQAYYHPHWALMPNLAFDLFMQAMMRIMPLGWAVRLFCVATVLLLFLGVRAVNRAIDPDARFYRAAPLLIYGGPFQFGFLSFCFATGLALLLFGLWLRRREDPFLRQLLVFLPASACLILCHLAAFAMFALVVGGFELSLSLRRSRTWSAILARQCRLAAFLVPPFLAMQWLGENAQRQSVVFGTVGQKLDSILAITLFSSPAIELPLLLLAGLGLVAALAWRIVRLDPAAWVVLPVMILAWLVAPRTAAGGGYVDYRLPWMIALLALALARRGAEWPRFGRGVAAFFLGLASARILSIAILWLLWEPVIADIDAALGRLPEGARLMIVQGDGGSISASRRPSLLHVAAYAVIDRHAFEPQLYASLPGQTLDFTPRWRSLQTIGAPSAVDRLNPAYTHMLVIDPDHARLGVTLPRTETGSGRRFALYAVTSATDGHAR